MDPLDHKMLHSGNSTTRCCGQRHGTQRRMSMTDRDLKNIEERLNALSRVVNCTR